MSKTEAEQRKTPVKFEMRNVSYLACPILGCRFEAELNTYMPFLQFETVSDVRARARQYAEGMFNDLYSKMEVHIKERHSND